jgi:agmatine deiminase
MTWRMPSETDEHERTWMAYPVAGYTIGDTESERHEARATWAAVAHAIAEFEPVVMVVDPDEMEYARKYLSGDVETLVAPLDDSWIRDMGPTFVTDESGALAGVDWTFNAWGNAANVWSKDARIASTVIEAVGAQHISSVLVNEGGGINVDGEGTVLLTETVQLDPGRNPFTDKARVEAEFARTLGATTFIWLPRGLTRDYERFGTKGHVDILATIPSPGTLLVHMQNDPAHPDHQVSRVNREVLAASRDAAGREWNILELPAPAAITDADGFVDYSYVNHLVVNGGVIACGFGESNADAVARDVLSEAYPGRRVVTVDARPLFERGGGIHCITQQQPKV